MRSFAALPLLFACGCQSAATVAPADAGADLAEPSRPPTQFPVGHNDGGAPAHKYPIVLAHGMSGFKNIGPLNYFYGVEDALRKDGFDVFVSKVDAFNSSDVRGAELLTFVQGVLMQTGADKVDLIGHSQGGFDVRVVANKIPDHVAAVVTIATPHLGDPIADIADNDLPGPLKDAVSALLDLFGATVVGPGDQQNAQLAIDLLTTKGSADFTTRYPNQRQVAYFSITGRSNGSLGDGDCATPNEAPFIARWDAYVDPVNPLLAASAAILNNSFNPVPTNDGLVPVGSAKWGTFLGCIPADHLDEVGQIGGQSPGTGNPFDHILFYRQLAAWLVAQGY